MTDDIEWYSDEPLVIGWVRMPILSANSPWTKMYTCIGQYHSSGYWKRLWLRLKIWYYRRLLKNDR